MFVGTMLVGPPSVLYLYLFYHLNIGSMSEAQLRTVPRIPPRRDDVDTKYILTWCQAYGSLKYGWEFGEEKFR